MPLPLPLPFWELIGGGVLGKLFSSDGEKKTGIYWNVQHRILQEKYFVYLFRNLQVIGKRRVSSRIFNNYSTSARWIRDDR